MTKVCVVGAAGRMGRLLVKQLGPHQELDFGSALDREEDEVDGHKIVNQAAQALEHCELVIDFAAPAAIQTVVPLCVEGKIPYLVGSTALSREDQVFLDKAAQSIAVLEASNMSVGINLLLELAELAAQRLGNDFDSEIFEIHHRNKSDAPSGTALSLGKALQQGRGQLREVKGRVGKAKREADELGYGALRGGDVSGEHTVFFFGEGERIELTHRATTPEIFVRGALRAAVWLSKQEPGRYTMRDVLAGK